MSKTQTIGVQLAADIAAFVSQPAVYAINPQIQREVETGGFKIFVEPTAQDPEDTLTDRCNLIWVLPFTVIVAKKLTTGGSQNEGVNLAEFDTAMVVVESLEEFFSNEETIVSGTDEASFQSAEMPVLYSAAWIQQHIFYSEFRVIYV